MKRIAKLGLILIALTVLITLVIIGVLGKTKSGSSTETETTKVNVETKTDQLSPIEQDDETKKIIEENRPEITIEMNKE